MYVTSFWFSEVRLRPPPEDNRFHFPSPPIVAEEQPGRRLRRDSGISRPGAPEREGFTERIFSQSGQGPFRQVRIS